MSTVDSQIQLYQVDNQVSLEVNVEQDTVWLSQAQMSDLFGRDVSVISRHINNAIGDEEVDLKSNLQKVQIAFSDKPVTLYDLDVIISVGYRIKSKQGVMFRKWATRILKEHLIQGFSINQQRLQQNTAELEQAIALIKKTAQSEQHSKDSALGLVEIISRYTQTFLWLQRYDEGLLHEPVGQPGGEVLDAPSAMQALNQLKSNLMDKKEATDLFAKPRGDGLAAILGNIQQTAFGEEVYPSIESKAAHLLYFVVKNHPFADGNKRSAAFLFVDFLYRNNRLFNDEGTAIINDTGLAALTLLIAESDPTQKEVLIRLVMNLLVAKDKDMM